MVFGAPYWLLPIGNVASALLSHSLSPKVVIGFSILLGSILNVVTPFAANLNYSLLIGVRLVLGFIVVSTVFFGLIVSHQSSIIAKFLYVLSGVSISFGSHYRTVLDPSEREGTIRVVRRR